MDEKERERLMKEFEEEAQKLFDNLMKIYTEIFKNINKGFEPKLTNKIEIDNIELIQDKEEEE